MSVHRPLRRRARLAGAVAALAVLATGAAVTAPVGAAPATCGSAPCPTVAPGPFRFTFTSELTNGTIDLNGKGTATGASASVCGTIAPSGGQLVATVPQANISFSPVTVNIFGFLPVQTQVVPVGDQVGTASLGGGINVTLSGPVVAETNLLGFRCDVGPFTPTLTTGTSGALTGTPFSGNPSTGALVSNDFDVPRIAPSRTCPRIVAFFSNLALGLPAPAGASSIAFDATQVLTPVR